MNALLRTGFLFEKFYGFPHKFLNNVKVISGKIWHSFFLIPLKKCYFTYYPLEDEMFETLNLVDKSQIKISRRRINDIRFKNIEATFFANTGAILSLQMAYISFVLALGFLFIDDMKSVLPKALALLIIFILAYCFFIFTVPILLRRILDHLSPDEYAKISLIKLDKSELLTFISYKNWKLIYDFRINHPDIKNNNGPSARRMVIKHLTEFESKNYSDIQKCITLVTYSAEKLCIHKRELVNHILQFSPAIFEVILSNSINTLDTFEYLSHEEFKNNNSKHKKSIYSYKLNYLSYFEELKKTRLRNLEQILFFQDIHKYLIGMSSNISTSLSLKIFIRGLSEIIQGTSVELSKKEEKQKKYSPHESTKKGPIQLNNDENIKKRIESLLKRSKSHCGVDLLIPLTNWLRNDIDKLKLVKKEGPGDKGGFKVTLINGEPKQFEIHADLRYKFHRYEIEARGFIKNKFKRKLESLTKKNGAQIYFIIFGYSDLLKICLKKCDKVITSKGIRILILQEENIKSLDTRTFRYELSRKMRKEKGELPAMTGRDNLLQGLSNKGDQVIFLSGIELFSEENCLLFHTNNYLDRVEKLFKKMEAGQKEVWLLGEGYKIHKDFPNSVEYEEFFDDHYNNVDLYDLKKLGSEVKIEIISEKEVVIQKVL